MGDASHTLRNILTGEFWGLLNNGTSVIMINTRTLEEGVASRSRARLPAKPHRVEAP